MKKTLREWAPAEFVKGEFANSKAMKFENVEIVEIHDGCSKPWVGKEKNVYNWVVLKNGWAVGWNENPARGWSFPVVKVMKIIDGCTGCNRKWGEGEGQCSRCKRCLSCCGHESVEGSCAAKFQSKCNADPTFAIRSRAAYDRWVSNVNILGHNRRIT